MLYLTNDKSAVRGGYGLFLSGEELDEVRDLFKNLPHDSSPFSLEFSPTKFADVCDVLCDYEVTSERPDIRKKIATHKPKIMEVLPNPVLPKFKLNPHQYQLDAIKYGIEHPRFLLGDEMGLGKTGTMIFLSEILKAHYGFKHTLIVCGINGAKFNWHQIEVPKFSYEKSHIIGGKINSKGNFVIGDIPSRLADLQAEHDEFYLIINIESLRDETIAKELKSMIVRGDIGMVVIDEVHMASGSSSSQGKAIHELRPKFRVGLTGTPIHNKPLDIYNIMKWLGYEYMSFTEFRLEYCYEIQKTMRTSSGVRVYPEYVYKDLTELHNRLKEFMLRRTVDVLHLPEPSFKDEYVELDKKQLTLYNKIKDDILKSGSYHGLFSAEEVMTNPAVQFIKARQAVSCPSIFGVKEDAKLQRVVEIASEALENGKSIVVFAWFNATINSYIDYLRSKFGDCVLGVTEDTKNVQDVVTQFQTSEKPQILIGTIGKLGTSYTITRADLVIFVDKHVMWSTYKQAYMRVWRQGQTKTVVIINIMAKDTVDERLDFLIAMGKSHAEQVVDGIQNEEYIKQKYSLEQFL